MTAICGRCPECGGTKVETTRMLAVIGHTPRGQEVLESQEVFACTECEWIREVKAEQWRQRKEAMAR